MSQHPIDVDHTQIFDPSIEAIESPRLNQPLIYKYFSRERRGFFQKPQLRFSQREILNDPFEMRRRWKETRVDHLRAVVVAHCDKVLSAFFSSPRLLIAEIAEQATQQGMLLSEADLRQAEARLSAPEWRLVTAELLMKARENVHFYADAMFAHIENASDQFVESWISKVGVLSLTEDAANPAMWAHYGDQGRGFVVGLDTQHDFFHGSGEARRPLLRKVLYTDALTENLWKNPFYLFMVKSTHWSYEREWRMFKFFEDAEQRISAEPPVCLWNVPSTAIKEVHFGYAYSETDMGEDIAALHSYHGATTFFRVRADHVTGSFVTIPATGSTA